MIELNEKESQALLEYLSSRPISEAYVLFNTILGKINESKLKPTIEDGEDE